MADRSQDGPAGYTRRVIVVIGPLAYVPAPDGGPGAAAGLAAGIAGAAAAAGARVELAAKVGDDSAGDAVLMALGRAGVGHAATLRDPSRPTPSIEAGGDDGSPLVPLDGGTGGAGASVDAAPGASAAPDDAAAALDAGDIDLALGYLLDPRVIVLAQPVSDAAAAAAARAAAFSDATLIAVVAAGAAVPPSLERAIVFERDSSETEELATLVGRFAASIDAGSDAAVAFAEARDALGWLPAGD